MGKCPRWGRIEALCQAEEHGEGGVNKKAVKGQENGHEGCSL